jgi:hypothetical protein
MTEVDLKQECLDAYAEEASAWDDFVDSSTDAVFNDGNVETAVESFGEWVHDNEVADTICDAFEDSYIDHTQHDINVDLGVEGLDGLF